MAANPQLIALVLEYAKAIGETRYDTHGSHEAISSELEATIQELQDQVKSEEEEISKVVRPSILRPF